MVRGPDWADRLAGNIMAAATSANTTERSDVRMNTFHSLKAPERLKFLSNGPLPWDKCGQRITKGGPPWRADLL